MSRHNHGAINGISQNTIVINIFFVLMNLITFLVPFLSLMPLLRMLKLIILKYGIHERIITIAFS